MQKRVVTLERLIDLAAEMEKISYDFYDALERRFSNNPEFLLCIKGVKEDELLHLRVLNEIRDSLSPVRLQAEVTVETVEKIEKNREFMKSLDIASLESVDQICEIIRQLESVEFDVVMEFVSLDEIDFEFTKEYLRNESLEHGAKIFHAQECLL